MRVTPQALYYMEPGALVEKLIVVDERNGSSMADYSIRTMQTSNTLTVARPGKSSKFKSVKVRSAYMESTTSEEINPENASRCLILNLDESQESTASILKAQRKARNTQEFDRTPLIKWHHDFQNKLESLPVIIPYVESIRFPSEQVIYRREQGKFLSLIEASALVHQYQRKIVAGYIEANLEDYEIALELYLHVFKGLQQELSRNASLLLGQLEKESVSFFSIREAIDLTGWSHAMVNRCVKELQQYKYLGVDHSENGKKRTYRILDYSMYGNKISKLMGTEELSQSLEETV